MPTSRQIRFPVKYLLFAALLVCAAGSLIAGYPLAAAGLVLLLLVLALLWRA